MQTFKLTPKPQSDYRLEVNEIRKKCQLEKYGYRHNKIIYGFCEELPDMAELQSLGLNIEALPFEAARPELMVDLVERGRKKSKIEHLLNARERKGEKNQQEEADVQQKLTELNSKIQATKESLDIVGTLKIMKF